MTCQIHRSLEDGFETITLSNAHLSLTVVPALGAKLISLIDRRTGRQWLWRSNKTPQLFHVTAGTPFDCGPLLGADECIPTIAPCHWRGRHVPDHGEAWSEPWELDETALLAAELVTRVNLKVTPLTLERRIRLDGGIATLSYILQNRSDDLVEYLWAFHPMLTYQKHDRIVLPQQVKVVRTELTLGDLDLGERGHQCPWPQPCKNIDFSQAELGGSKRAVKLYTESLTGDEMQASVFNDTTDDRLTFRFTVGEINTLGIWINRGGFGGYEHIAIEPASGAPDAIDLAVESWRRAQLLPPGQDRRWQFALQVT